MTRGMSEGRLAWARRTLRAALRFPHRVAQGRPWRGAQVVRILDLFEEHVYAGEVRPDGSYVHHASGVWVERLLGGTVPPGADVGTFWESRIPADDLALYDAFNLSLLRGEDAEVTYRLKGLDGVTRVLRDRARPRPKADGGVMVDGIISDVTAREEAAASLAEANDRFTSMLDVVGAHVYLALAYPDGTLEELFQGPGGERLLGGAEPDPDMVNWDNAVHPDDREAYDEFNAGLGQGRDGQVEYRLIGLDGITRWVHDRAVCRPRPDGTFEVSGIVSDVTERRRLEDELRRSVREMQAAQIELERARADAELLAATDDLTGTYNRRRFVQIATAALTSGDDSCALLLLDADHFKQINDAYGHSMGDTVLVGLAGRLRQTLAANDCLARWGGEEFAVLLRGVQGEADLVDRAERLRAAVGSDPIARLRLTVSIGAVLAGSGADLDALLERADGCLYAAKRDGRDRVSLRPRAQSEAPLGRDEPEAVGMARALAYAAGLREGIPEEHADSVARLAAQTAVQMGLSAEQVLRARLAGWLHDVGKIAVSEGILTKPGPLDDAEWDVMRTHPDVGAGIVARIAILGSAAAGVRHHHERFAGGGYPDGIAGLDIPVEARIVAAADAYSAMTTTRPYSVAREPAVAAQELRRSAGSHFDPAVVDALLAVLGLDEDVSRRAA
jgi:diguanylate cyclase (GGDEF)-like protein